MDTLLGLYNSYQRKDVSPHTPLQKCVASSCRYPASSVSAQEADDVLVKLVRVLANMCIHPAVGPPLANNTTCLQLLMETLGEHSSRHTAVGFVFFCLFSCISSYKGSSV